MQPIEISPATERRFVLGRQGLWPGRRWQGLAGTIQAVRAAEGVQLDPLVMVARSQEIFLYSRVLDYQIGYLEQAAYRQRQFFDFGGTLFLYPMSELPYWAPHMNRADGYWANYLRENADLAAHVRAALAERGPLGNRDFEGKARVNSYRGRKDTALALYAMWMTGQVMVHHRQGFDRVYDLREKVVPAEWDWAAGEAEAEAHFARKVPAYWGIARERGFAGGLADGLHRAFTPPEARRKLEQYYENGLLTPLRVAGVKEPKLVLTEDLPDLETLERGEVPARWKPLGPTTLEEAVILAPLDIVFARGRSEKLFDFEYKWEVYVPAEKRRWGYYNVPILYGDRLVARTAPRLDRKTNTLVLTGLWLEDEALGRDAPFADALSACLRRFMNFLGATGIVLDGVQSAPLRELLLQRMGS
jgi:uncharacterized protein YcaQ